MLFPLVAALSLLVPFQAPSGDGPDRRPFWSGHPTAESFARRVDRRLQRARKTRDRLVGVQGPRTIANTLVLYDRILRDIDATHNEALLVAAVHPDSMMRAAADSAERRSSQLRTETSLDRSVYEAVAAVDLSGADSATRHYVERTILAFHLAGVDKDEANREKIQALREELVQLGLTFSRNIREDRRTVSVASAAELDGLPADFIAAHRPGPEGRIELTTADADALLVLTYARSGDLRRRFRAEYDNVAFPANMAVLDQLIARRDELAHLLGYSSWADYITADKMAGSAANASAFIERIAEASRPAARAEYETLLRRKRRDEPEATVVNRWESAYYRELVRRSDYDFDSQLVRPYFPYDAVKRGVLDVSSRLFQVSFRRMPSAPVWDPSVEGWEMLERGKLVGRFYLDMHPRPSKYKGAAHFPIRTGTAGGDLPESALVCSFPGGGSGDPGLMSHEQVVSLFHEFGHLMHSLLGGRQRWVGISGVRTERDFVEAPSQMLEEWAWDPEVLATFARHYQTGERMSAELARQMRRASEFGRALEVRQQMAYARISLALHDRPPARVNTDSITAAVLEAYTPFPPMAGTHIQAGFGHLDSYSAIYYTYMWSKVIAKDLFSGFDRRNLFAAEPALRYRRTILAPGGSAPAAKLVESFLGRPFGLDAWRRWLEGEESGERPSSQR